MRVRRDDPRYTYAHRLDGESVREFQRRQALGALDYLTEKCCHGTTVASVKTYIRVLERRRLPLGEKRA